jgi:hypothetical protein
MSAHWCLAPFGRITFLDMRVVATLRRQIAALLIVPMLHVMLVASARPCDPATTSVAAMTSGAVEGAATHAGAHHHGGAPASPVTAHTSHATAPHATAPHATAPDAPAPAHPHETGPSACPMAMSCLMTAMTPVTSQQALLVASYAPRQLAHNDDVPRSPRAAPEPPPPRG